ncbi:MAG: tRNA preQ1(34) S-adenosylmethionine ribosyltransferase-isomerase QueA [Deltaproteobacteria bacterium]|nr:tRNA preQ1(34) S-adenosylmethionine ribosyltransferase-isomerase QueA [Deltaproteobacteria bacterium]
MRTEDFAYDLPEAQIASAPASVRDASRLLVLGRNEGGVKDAVFGELLDHLRPRSLVIRNDTRVIPARLSGRKPTGGVVEVFLIRRIDTELSPAGKGELWEVLVRGAGNANRIDVAGCLEVELVNAEPDGSWKARITSADAESVLSVASRLGTIPLPPYIVAARKRDGHAASVPTDDERYQTVYARHPGAVAAPTAGLHFTPELFARMETAGHQVQSLTLHVGPGTFRPVKTDDPREHIMDVERYEIPLETRAAIASARAEGRPIVAIGTTVVRALESAAREGFLEGMRESRLFLMPGATFEVVTDLITNFHLPRSTLLMLVCAFAGHASVLAAYHHAIASNYRFYSYGDAMFIRPEKAS